MLNQLSIPLLSYLKLAFACIVAMIALFPQQSTACTSLVLQTTSFGQIYGRTMEFGQNLYSKVVVIPRAYTFYGITPNVKVGMVWKNKYAMSGQNAFDQPAIVDGVNEAGMSCGILYFPGYANYTPSTANVPKDKIMAPWQFCTWALSLHATTAEVAKNIGKVVVMNVGTPSKNVDFPAHYTLHDKCGGSIVIEPLNGQLIVTQNPLTVMTNAPPIDWHYTNVKNYVQLTPYNRAGVTLNGQFFPPVGQGSGWLGLPGDATPPSRFIRALAAVQTADNSVNVWQSVRIVEHIMDSFELAPGVIRDNTTNYADFTQYTSVALLNKAVYYTKTLDNNQLKRIDMKDFDLNARKIYSVAIAPQLEVPNLNFATGR